MNLPLIWREFGTACAMRCVHALVTRRQTTFLEISLCRDLKFPSLPTAIAKYVFTVP